MSRTVRTRRFGNQLFQNIRYYRKKSDAKRFKESVKSSFSGGYVRIIPEKIGYSVWTRIR